MTCADEDKAAMDVTLECFRGFAVCLERSQEKGVVYGTDTYEAGSVKIKKSMQEAYKMG